MRSRKDRKYFSLIYQKKNENFRNEKDSNVHTYIHSELSYFTLSKRTHTHTVKFDTQD